MRRNTGVYSYVLTHARLGPSYALARLRLVIW